jgi:uncharacterized membrane protein (UPF0127 family)
MIVKYKNKKIEVPAKRVSFFGKVRGLMFRGKNTGNLLFEFEKKNLLAIHSYFVFFDFLAVWLDDENNVIDIKIVNPFEFHVCPKFSFTKLLELPINDKNSQTIEFFVGKR